METTVRPWKLVAFYLCSLAAITAVSLLAGDYFARVGWPLGCLAEAMVAGSAFGGWLLWDVLMCLAKAGWAAESREARTRAELAELRRELAELRGGR